MVPARPIKVHQQLGAARWRRRSRRLADGCRERRRAPARDRIEPVRGRARFRARTCWGVAPGVPPRAAFTFSMFPYGSTNLVITDVIEGSHEAVVGPGQHQLLFANVGAKGALHREPRRGSTGPPGVGARLEGARNGRRRAALLPHTGAPAARRARLELSTWARRPSTVRMPPPMASGRGMPMPSVPPPPTASPSPTGGQAGLERVAIGHGETEGAYGAGGGYRGARADEPIRVTVVHFRHARRSRDRCGHGDLRQGVHRLGQSSHLGRQLRRQEVARRSPWCGITTAPMTENVAPRRSRGNGRQSTDTLPTLPAAARGDAKETSTQQLPDEEDRLPLLRTLDPIAASAARSARDVLLQSIELAVAAEELGADGAYFRVHHFARQLASPFPLLAAVGARTSASRSARPSSTCATRTRST